MRRRLGFANTYGAGPSVDMVGADGQYIKESIAPTAEESYGFSDFVDEYKGGIFAAAAALAFLAILKAMSK